MELTYKELRERIEYFFSQRCVRIDEKLMIPADNMTQHILCQELLKSNDEYYKYDDFRSRV